jgi:hypothetical protein
VAGGAALGVPGVPEPRRVGARGDLDCNLGRRGAPLSTIEGRGVGAQAKTSHALPKERDLVRRRLANQLPHGAAPAGAEGTPAGEKRPTAGLAVGLVRRVVAAGVRLRAAFCEARLGFPASSLPGEPSRAVLDREAWL